MQYLDVQMLPPLISWTFWLYFDIFLPPPQTEYQNLLPTFVKRCGPSAFRRRTGERIYAAKYWEKFLLLAPLLRK